VGRGRVVRFRRKKADEKCWTGVRLLIPITDVNALADRTEIPQCGGLFCQPVVVVSSGTSLDRN